MPSAGDGPMKGLEHIGPRAVGYDLDVRSVFDT